MFNLCKKKMIFLFSDPKQGGSALILAIVFLLVLTIMAVAGMQSSSLQERMAGNLRDKDIAFQAAEAALRDAEIFLQTASLPDFNNTLGLYETNMSESWTNPIFWEDLNNSYPYHDDDFPVDNVIETPRYIIEELAPVQLEGESAVFGAFPDIGMFRITARGLGGSESAEVILQTTLRR